MAIDFTSTVIAGTGAPLFRLIYNGITQHRIQLLVPHGTSTLKFIPNGIKYNDINNHTRFIHRGFDVEFRMKYVYMNATEMKKLIKVFSWRSFDPNLTMIRCQPHYTDFPRFWFDGQFDGELDFNYVEDKYLAHSVDVVFRSTNRIQDIPRHTANRIINRRVY